MAFTPFTPQPTPQMPTRRQFGITGGEDSRAIAKGFDKAGDLFKSYDEMLTKRAEAKRLADIAARELAMKEETHLLNQDTGKLANENAIKTMDITQAKEDRAVTQDERDIETYDTELADEENAKLLIESGKFKDLMPGMSKENGGVNANIALGRMGYLAKTKTGKAFLDNMKIQDTYHAPPPNSYSWGGKNNPTDTQINNALDQLNLDIKRSEADLNNVINTPIGRQYVTSLGEVIDLTDDVTKKAYVINVKNNLAKQQKARVDYLAKLKTEPKDYNTINAKLDALEKRNDELKAKLGLK